MLETFSCERVRTDSVGVRPHGAHVRRSTGIIKKPVSSRQIRWAPRRRSFFYPAPVTQDPVAHPPIVALLGAGLGPLGAEATRAEQSPDVIRMVDDFELTTDEVDDPSTRPQACAIAGRFRPRHHQAGQSMPLREAEFRRSTRRRAGAQPGAALSSVRALPSADGTPSDAEAPGHHMHRKVALEQFDGAQASLLELSRAPLWAHAVPPTAEYNFSRTSLTQVSLVSYRDLLD